MAALTAFVGLVAACGAPGGVPDGGGPSGATPAVSMTGPADVDPAEWLGRREAAVRAALQARARAVRGGDAAPYLAYTQSGPERERDRTRYTHMVALGVSEVTLVSAREVVPPVPVASEAAAKWDVEATFDYRIGGFDREPRRFVLDMTFSAPPASPERLTITASRPSDRPQPWDIENMQVRRSDTVLVVGSGAGADLDEVLARASRASTQVRDVWGVVAPSVWVVPSDVEQAEHLLGRDPGGLDDVAAATDGPLEPGVPAGADRIVLNPEAWSSLQPLGRDVVLTHELTHVAVRATTVRGVPLWLSEGLAEYVAYRGVRLPEATVAAPLVSRLRAEGVPSHLPGPDRFDPGTGDIAAAYAEAWLAVRTLVETHGEAQVVRFYRDAASAVTTEGSSSDPDTIAEAALARVLRTTLAEVETAWRDRVRSLLS